LEEPVLKMIDTTKQFVLETDASKWATGAVLKQLGEDGELHPCRYISKMLTSMERNYQIYDRELLQSRYVNAYGHYIFLLLTSLGERTQITLSHRTLVSLQHSYVSIFTLIHHL
jgi:RNase H-like domain found in reverse transcriptase